MNPSVPGSPPATTPLLSLDWDHATWAFSFSASIWLVVFFTIIIILLIGWRWRSGGYTFRDFEIDEAEFGIGNSKFRFKPNLTDRQVAYAIWVELSTRKIGLPIDLDHDVIVEIYNSWYEFFSVTRDLVKNIPAIKIKRDSTQKIIKLSVEVLNEGLRPHLTRWQARFRIWYEREMKRYEKAEGHDVLDPQQIQAQFPNFTELRSDMQRVNEALVRYRAKMEELAFED